MVYGHCNLSGKMLALFQNLCQTYLYVNSYIALNALTLQDYGYAQPPNSVLHWTKKCLNVLGITTAFQLLQMGKNKLQSEK